MILFVRPLAVFLSTVRSTLGLREKTFLAAMAPRGIVAAAVSSVFSLRLAQQGEQGALILMPTTFLVISLCVVVYGLGARPLIKLLGLAEQSPRGVLFLGAHRAARSLAEGLKKAGVPVVLVDSNRANVMKSRSLGLRAEHGRLLSEHVQNRLDLGSIGMLVAMTSSEDANTLAVTHFRRILGPEHVHQLAPSRPSRPKRHRDAPQVQGSTFSPHADFTRLAHLAETGTTKLTPLTEEFSYDDFLAHYGQSVLPLFVIDGGGLVRVINDESAEPKPGEQILGLLSSQQESPRKGVTGRGVLVAQ
jgi:CPA1 family monovalent cation:H+ antiporter